MTVASPIEFRLCGKVDFTQGDCWVWAAGRNNYGYGVVDDEGRKKVAHRLVFELLVGPIPHGLHLDHLCRNRGCVNPAHLEPVTQRTNLLRGTGVTAKCAAKTHCGKGHPLSGDNLYVYPNGKRRCRTCKRAQDKKQHQKKLAEVRSTVCESLGGVAA